MLQCNRITLRCTDKALTTANVPAAACVAGNGCGQAVPFRHARGAGRCVQGRDDMPIESLIVWLIIGAIAGWLAGLIVKGFGFGLIGNIVVGIVGAFIAGFLLPRLGIVIGSGIIAAIINAVIGAVILLVIVGLIRKAT
jgi:uncharacterized membrane protein YeaQ/YmgE (transglycosylase-associated protein family)